MATVTPPSPTRNLEQDQVKVRSPLARLRKYIHTYVSLEGAALVGLFLALWFWVGFVLDYVVFKVTLIDWVQVLPWGVRAGVLVAGLSALAALLLVYLILRLFREFSDPSLALVLERRFPDLLGDRLITAVEMSDPKQAARYGYSPALVQETIHEAADRVDQVPVGQVFDWSRLIRRGIVLGLLTLAMYLLVGGTFCAARSLRGEDNLREGYADFNEVAGIWGERNILLRNTIWPRRAYLEVLPWERTKEASALDPGAGGATATETIDPNELRIPQNSTPPTLRVRAWKYVVADNDAPEGWRPLAWADLQRRRELTAGGEVPDVAAGWTARDANVGLTVDEVELLLEAFPVRAKRDGEELPAKWCVASAAEESGWRPLMWSDLTKEKLGGLDVPAIPGSWDPKALPATAISGGLQPNPLAGAARLAVGPKFISLSVDEVEEKLDAAKKKDPADPAAAAVAPAFDRLRQYAALRATIDRVQAAASRRDMRRTMRQLIVPDNVVLTYSSTRSTSTSSMTRIAGNEYTGNFSELKESVTFTVRGEDYVTQKRTITVVERPRVEVLESEEERPAYLYYRTSGDIVVADIRGQRQPLEPVKLSVTGDTTTLDVPSGTNVTLKATISKPLKQFAVAVEAKDKKSYRGEKPERADDRSFTVRLPDVRREQRFKLIFEDGDEVVAERKIIVQPKDDTSPRVREFNPDEVIRRGRGSEGHVVAVGCRIPFKGRVADDHGLSRIRYACRVIPGDFLSEQKARALLGIGGVGTFGPYSGGPMLGTAYFLGLHKELAQSAVDEAGPEQYVDLPAFAQAMAVNRPGDGQEEILSKETVLSRLKMKQREPYRQLLREFQLTPDRWVEQWAENDEDMKNPARWFKANDPRSPVNCDLPLWRLTWRDKDGKDKPLRDPDDTKPQKRFVIEVRLLADDTYLDGEQPVPHTSPSGETFTFVVLPENELLARIAEEEETKYKEMQKAAKPIQDNLEQLRNIHAMLASGPGGLNDGVLTSFLARCDTLSDALQTSHQDVKGVYNTYERIVKEMRVNQIREDVLTKVYRTIYVPLSQASETQFDKAKNAVMALRRELDTPSKTVEERAKAAEPKAGEAKAQVAELDRLLSSILSAMEGLSKLNELIAELARIERQEEDLEGVVTRLLQRRIKEELSKPD
jgi:hypothetical protein